MDSHFSSAAPSWRSLVQPNETLPRMVSTVFADYVGPFPQGNVLFAPAEYGDALPGNLVSFAPMYQYERCQIDSASGSALCNVIECGGAA